MQGKTENIAALKAQKDKLGLQMLDSCMQPRGEGENYQICDEELEKIKNDCDTFKQTCADPRLSQYFALRTSSSYNQMTNKEASNVGVSAASEQELSNIDVDYSRKLDSCLEPRVLNSSSLVFSATERIDCDRFVGSTLFRFCSDATTYHTVCNDDRRSKYESLKTSPIPYIVEIVIIDPLCNTTRTEKYVTAFNVDKQAGITSSCLADDKISTFADIENIVIPKMRAAGNTHQLLFAYPEDWKDAFHSYNTIGTDIYNINTSHDTIGVGFAPDKIYDIASSLCIGNDICSSEDAPGSGTLIVH